ncbi:hypothetical protein ARTHROSP310_15380 [Arthrobacter sp. AD-310]
MLRFLDGSAPTARPTALRIAETAPARHSLQSPTEQDQQCRLLHTPPRLLPFQLPPADAMSGAQPAAQPS